MQTKRIDMGPATRRPVGTTAAWSAGWVAAGVAALLAAGCASYGPPRLPASATVADVEQQMGKPTTEYPLPGGAKRLEFARGPFGKHTYMVDVDSQGRVRRWEQVLTEARFNGVLAGMPKEEVLLALGRPSEQSRIDRQRLTVWSYRFEGPFCRWFQIGIDAAGKVSDAGYYPDPLCEDRNDNDRT